MRPICFLILGCLLPCLSFAQHVTPNAATTLRMQVHHHTRGAQQTTAAAALDTALRPFYYGVASGDPTTNDVVIWTHVTPAPDSAPSSDVEVAWRVATDTGMVDIVEQGTLITNEAQDFTVKVTVNNLDPNTYYYYEFTAEGRNSLRGRTKTTPAASESQHLRFGVVSCSNYEVGYFNAYARLAERNDLDAIIHLGDYIYEDVDSEPDSLNPRDISEEAATLEEYRARYALYHLDPDLRRVHQQHPFINGWDDHEIAQNNWSGGSVNHDSTIEGSWAVRIAAARQAYFEWIPIRPEATGQVYRSIRYGDLMDLFMLDNRLEGRDSLISDINNPALYASDRTMLGQTQYDWLIQNVTQSTARWQVIGTSVLFSPFNIAFLGNIPGSPYTPDEIEGLFLDIWDGYPAERQRLISLLDSVGRKNTVFLAGDLHSTFATEVADPVNDVNNDYAPVPTYDPTTGAGAVAVEFATPSITSNNFDELLGTNEASFLEGFMNSPFPTNVPNPHMKFLDLDRHGYMIFDLKTDTAAANWYYVDRIDSISSGQTWGQTQFVLRDTNYLRSNTLESKPKAVAAIAAPLTPRSSTLTVGIGAPAMQALVRVYPNPTSGRLRIQLAQAAETPLHIELLDSLGKLIQRSQAVVYPAGISDISLNLTSLVDGLYLLRLVSGDHSITRKVHVQR